MSDALLRHKRLFCGALGALAFVLGMEVPAQARGIVADSPEPLPTNSFAFCDFATTCTTPYLLSTNTGSISIYAYADGLVTIGAPLSSPPTSPFTASSVDLGSSDIAPGLYDYGASAPTTFDSGGSQFDFELRWTIGSGVNGSGAGEYGIDFGAQPDGSVEAVVMYDDSPFALPDGALIASSFAGCQTSLEMSESCTTPPVAAVLPVTADANYTYPNYVLTIPAPTNSVPEPATWSLMLFGLGAAGLMASRLRRRGTLETST